jgi:hypothetical protein
MFTTGEGMQERDLVRLGKSAKCGRFVFHVRAPGDYAIMRGGSGVVWGMLDIIKRHVRDPEFVVVDAHISAELLTCIDVQLRNAGLPAARRQPWVSRAKNKIVVLGELMKIGDNSKRPVQCIKVNEQKQPVVFPNGDVVVCCNDYGCELTIGNLLTNTWSALAFDRVLEIQRNPEAFPDAPCFRDCHFAEPAPPN